MLISSVLHSGSSLHSDSASGDSGTRMQRVNNGETGFTNLSTLSLKAPAFDAKVDFSEPNGALNQIAEDVQLQSDEALSQNATLHRSSLLSVSSSNEKCKSQIQMPLLKPNDALHQISELKSFTPSCSSLSDKSSLSKFDSLLNEQTAKFLNIQTNQRYIRDKPAALNMKAEIASQALASDVVNRLSTGSIEEIQLLIKNRLINFFGADRKRKRSPESSPLDEGSDMKRNRVTCEICTKTMGRQCDLKCDSSLNQSSAH